MPTEFEAVIGLEVHAQLSTESKIFCSCPARQPAGVSVADLPANSQTCPVCTGQPGALPVLNRRAVEYAIRAGLATHCRINERSVFARKNYFYADLPKGYQISQYDLPICEEGWLEITASKATRRIRIQRIHLEEDAGKSVHMHGYSLVNLNRAGVPLIEIVSGPDLKSSEEAGAYLRALHGIVTYLGICDGNMQEGNFRCDANVSVRPIGSTELGVRTEIKNVNSFRFVEKAIDYEIARQIEVIRAGGMVVQETRTYEESRGVTVSLRSKEEAHDYRYFPDPDLVPVRVASAWIEQIRSELPELPHQKRMRYEHEFGLSEYDAGVLTSSRELADFFERAVALLEESGMERSVAAKPAANWMSGEVSRLINETPGGLSGGKLTPRHVADVVSLGARDEISSTNAKKLIGIAWRSGEDSQLIVAREGLGQVSDLGALEPAVDRVLAANPDQVAQYKAGKDKLLGFFVGQVMKQTGGKANPGLIQALIKKKLS